MQLRSTKPRHNAFPRSLLPLVLCVGVLCAAVNPLGADGDIPISPVPPHVVSRECQAALDARRCPPQTLPLCERALARSEQSQGPNSAETAKALSNLASCHFYNGQYAQAETSARRALEIRRRVLGSEDPAVREILNILAGVLDSQGRHIEAEQIFRQLIAAEQKHGGTESRELAENINNLAHVLGRRAQYAEAERLHRQALAMRQRLFGNEHAEVAESLHNLAYVIGQAGKFVEAEQRYRQVLALKRKLLGDDHPEVGTSQHNLALMLKEQARYAEAEELFQQTLSTWQKAFGPEHPNVLNALNGLATVFDVQGKFEEAEQLYRRGLWLRRKRLGMEHPDVAASLNNLAQVLDSQEKYTDAEDVGRQALAMRQKLLGAEHHQVAVSLNNLALVLLSQRKFSEAEEAARRALAVRQKHFGSEHPLVAVSYSTLARVLDYQGKYAEAESIFEQVLRIRRKVFGEEHPTIADSLNNLARHFLSRSMPEPALPLLKEAAAIRERQMRAVVSETRMLAHLQSHRQEEDCIYGLLLDHRVPGVIDLAMRIALLRKGRSAEAGARANRLVQRNLGRPELARRFAEWTAVRQQHESLLYGDVGKGTSEPYERQLQALKLQAEALEHALATDVPSLRDLNPPSQEEIVAQIAGRLSPGGVLIELLYAKPFEGRGLAGKQVWGKPHLVALLLFPDQRIVPVDLGDAARIDALALDLRRALASPLENPQPRAQALYAELFGKLKPHVAGRRDLFLSLDGALNLIPFDALHDGTDYLLGRYRFHYLTSGRDLLRAASQEPPSGALVMGNPHFGRVDAADSAAAKTIYQRFGALRDSLWAQREAEQIAGMLGVKPLIGVDAREEVLRGRRAPVVLHVATHGIAFADWQSGMLPAARSALTALPVAQGLPQPIQPRRDQLPGELGSMSQSALVFADVRGGHGMSDKSRDGLLTAEEARSLDLNGTQLVVLSGCETGYGEATTGQGVFGLRRAFLIAGAETLVTSLWSIHDEATGELMGMYYRKLLDKKRPGDRREAMIESMQELRARPGRSHPYYWAPFIVIGQGGPLGTGR